MEDLTYTPIGSVLHLNKAGELAQKRMKAAKLCDGLYITEPDKTQFVKFIVEYNGVKWVEHQAPAANINPANMAKRMPAILASIEGGRLNELNDYHKELHRRIFNPDTPAIMELKKPERKKSAPLPEGAKKVGVIMFKGCTDEMTDKKVIINEVAPHVYTHTYKLKGYGERVKIIFEIDGVYFQGTDNGAYVMESEDFNEICAKAYERARENVADGAAKGMRYFVEVQKRIDAATPPELAQTADTDAAITLPTEDINYMFYIKPKGEKRFSTYNPGKGTMNTGRVFTELYRKEHLPAVCKWIAEDMSGDFAYQLRSGDGKKIFWEHNPTAATPAETVRIVRVEIVRDFDKSYYANLYDENGGGHNLSKEYTDFRALTSLCKKEYGVNLPNLSQMEFETHGRKSYAYISTETPQIPTGTAEVGNVPVEEEKAEIKPICELYDNSEASPELEFELDAGLYYEWLKRTEKGSYKTIAEKAMAEAWINIFLAAYKRGKGHVLAMNERGELVDTVFVLNNASQPSETPQAVNHTADTSKPRETARKEPRRTISKMERVHAWQKLGAQGYLMLADASAILAVINAPPIRGDCKIGVFQRAKPPNSTLYKKISILQPP